MFEVPVFLPEAEGHLPEVVEVEFLRLHFHYSFGKELRVLEEHPNHQRRLQDQEELP